MVFGASHNLLVVRVVVDDLLDPIVGFIGLVLVVEGDGGLDVVDAAGPALGALELAVGPGAEVGNHLVQGLLALYILLVRHGVALLLVRLLAVLVGLLVLVLGDDVELSCHVCDGAKGKQCDDCEEEELEVVHFDRVVGA
jgi:hypothetical protein